MTKKLLSIAFAAVMAGAFVANADDGGLMGKKGGNNSGNNSGQNSGNNSGGSNPPRTVPPPTRGNNSGNNTGGNVSGNRGGSTLPPVVSGGTRTGNVQSSGSDNSIMNRARRQPAPNQSRSGEVQYGSVSNINQGGPLPQVQRQNTTYDIPQVFDRGGIGQDVNRQGNIQRGHNPQYRTGYYHYYGQWRDDYFYYPHYSFGYGYGQTVPSPFYRYHHLPAYINIFRVVIGGTSWNISGSSYRWNRPTLSVRGDRYNDLDYAIDDIVRSFEVGNVRFLDRLIPSNARVTVDLDQYSRYQLSGDDFYDLMRDAVEGTYTLSYNVREVRQDRNSATIRAEHRFRDSWGRTQTQVHLYGLQQVRRGYEIRHFTAYFR